MTDSSPVQIDRKLESAARTRLGDKPGTQIRDVNLQAACVLLHDSCELVEYQAAKMTPAPEIIVFTTFSNSICIKFNLN